MSAPPRQPETIAVPDSGLSPRQRLWLAQRPGETPTSTRISPHFLAELRPGSRILDIGCGTGRSAGQLGAYRSQLVGIDINARDLLVGVALRRSMSLVRGDAARMPFLPESFDYALALGVLGGIELHLRVSVLLEAARVLRAGSRLNVVEFALIEDPARTTDDGSPWHEIYERHLGVTGEYGSFVVYRPDRSPHFIAHHFRNDELQALLTGCGFEIIRIDDEETVSAVTGRSRPTWNIIVERRTGGPPVAPPAAPSAPGSIGSSVTPNWPSPPGDAVALGHRLGGLR